MYSNDADPRARCGDDPEPAREPSLVARVDELEQRCAQLQAALESSRRISLALGIAMATRRLTDTGAFEFLSAVSQRHNRKLRDLAEEIILTGTVPADLLP